MNSIILGKDVTKFARSPKVWNYLYKQFNIDRKMTAKDCTSEDLESTLRKLLNEKVIDCGLIASPLKDNPIWFKQQCSPNVMASKSANYFQLNPYGIIEVMNFDGPAAVKCLLMLNQSHKIKRVVLLGTGPVARNIQVELISELGIREEEIKFVTRRSRIEESKNGTASIDNFVSSQEIYDTEFDVLINCTPLGSPRQNVSPIDWGRMLKNNRDFFYFDVNYGSTEPQGVAKAREAGINYTDGQLMNSVQAAMAFSKANNLEVPLDDLIEIIRLT